jgi:hypothetical protein
MKVLAPQPVNVERVTGSLRRLDAWIEREEFRGWDPFDALNSPALKLLTFHNRRLGQVWVQLLKHSPINLRPLLRVPKSHNPKGMGLFLATYLRKYRMSPNASHAERIRFFADWLRTNTSPGYRGACWGYNFDWPNRNFFAPARTPTIVNTAFIALAFLDLFRHGELWDKSAALGIARSACDFVLNDLWSDNSRPGERCFSYTPLDQRRVHNANLLGARLLAEVYSCTHEDRLAQAALESARYSVRAQKPDGAWLYGDGSNDGWIDSFHTGYVLVALQRVSKCLNTTEFEDAINNGYRYWVETMFGKNGMPKYSSQHVHPIDTHVAAQAILTFLEFRHLDRARPAAWSTAQWAIDHLQDSAGYFYYQIDRRYTIRIPYMRWTQAWIQNALTELLLSS